MEAYASRSFDLVLSFDAPISYTYPNQERVIGELVRIARKRVMFSVSSRLGTLPYLVNPIQKNQFFLDEQTHFLDFCYQFDSNPYVCGMGKDNLLAVGDI